jgi:PTS system nitrogen regulatory IIA component
LMDNNEIMTLAEVARYLQLAEKTVLRMVNRGEIPGVKIASQWRFLRPVIRDWLAAQMQTMAPPEMGALAGGKNSILPLWEVMRPELTVLNMAAGPKESILKQLVAPLQETGFARKPAALLRSLIERERMMTTAVGHGIAMPHPRKPIPQMFPEPRIVLGVCPQGTNFEAIDDQLVHLFFLICATREEVHLHLMARVSFLTRREDIMSELMRQTSADKAVQMIARASSRLDSVIRTRNRVEAADERRHNKVIENPEI